MTKQWPLVADFFLLIYVEYIFNVIRTIGKREKFAIQDFHAKSLKQYLRYITSYVWARFSLFFSTWINFFLFVYFLLPMVFIRVILINIYKFSKPSVFFIFHFFFFFEGTEQKMRETLQRTICDCEICKIIISSFSLFHCFSNFFNYFPYKKFQIKLKILILILFFLPILNSF